MSSLRTSFLWLVASVVLAGCSSYAKRLELVPHVLDKEISRRYVSQAVHSGIYSGLDRIADLWGLSLDQTERQTLFKISNGSYEWLMPDQKGTLLLLVVNASLESNRNIQTQGGWHLMPEPQRMEAVASRFNAEHEAIFPPVTPWSRIYRAWYPETVSSASLQKGTHQFRVELGQ